MIRKIGAVLISLLLLLSLAACGDEEETTISGMVVSVEGSIISLAEMNVEDMEFSFENMPQMPEGMESFEEFENFDPSRFEGEFPGGENFPNIGSGEMPEDMTIPQFFIGKGFAPGKELEDVSLMDLAPTIAHIMGVPAADEWEGKVLAQ